METVWGCIFEFVPAVRLLTHYGCTFSADDCIWLVAENIFECLCFIMYWYIPDIYIYRCLFVLHAYFVQGRGVGILIGGNLVYRPGAQIYVNTY